MSTPDDKTKEVPTDASSEMEVSSTPKVDERTGGFVVLFFIIGLVASLVVGWVVFPKLLYVEKRQPIDFSHALHVAELGDCTHCHYFRADGSFAGSTRLIHCIDCHEEVIGEDPDEIRFVEEYLKRGRDVYWYSYADQPPNVFFSHAAHVKMAGMDCAECHGPMGEATYLRPYVENRITGYSQDIWGKNIAGWVQRLVGIEIEPHERMKMDDCAWCHAREKLPEDLRPEELPWPLNQIPLPFEEYAGVVDGCFVCHK